MGRIFEDVKVQFDMLSCLLSGMRDSDYYSKGKHIDSIGAHVRHMIEYVQVLVNADLKLPVNYGDRKRETKIESDKQYAIDVLVKLQNQLEKPDQKVSIKENGEIFTSSYLREILYMHEHIVHHCAILKIELNSLDYLQVDPCFGFAHSTLKHMEIKT